jgi:hypothetical protein
MMAPLVGAGLIVAVTGFTMSRPMTDVPPVSDRGVSRLPSPDSRLILQNTPALTLLYQNFPNPFPAPGVAFTCIWFDLHTASKVRLTIHDVRGTVLRTIAPSPILPSAFPAGRFGRGDPDANTGCDHRFSWDGNDEKGRRVPRGVYLVRLKTERFEGVKKIVFRGG